MVSLRSSGSLLCTLVAIITLAIILPNVSAKRGCSAFGHSCFGGHGKRSEGVSAEEMPQQPPVLPVEPLALPGGDNYNYYEPLLPPRAGPNGPNLVQAINSLPPVIRQWLTSYRRANDNFSMD